MIGRAERHITAMISLTDTATVFTQRHNAFMIYYMIYYPMRLYTELGMIESNFKK